jgi:hypothetical protein
MNGNISKTKRLGRLLSFIFTYGVNNSFELLMDTNMVLRKILCPEGGINRRMEKLA